MKAARRPASEIRTRKRGRWTRVYASEGGRDVSHLSYGPRELRVGRRGLVRVAAIGGVGTQQEARRRGLATRVLARAMEQIEEEGYSWAALYTSARIVAHRMYRRHGFVDVARSSRAFKLLDPERFVCDALTAMVKGGPELSRRRTVLRVTVRPHEPVHLRLDRGGARALRRAPRQVDLALTTTTGAFMALWLGDLTFGYAVGAKLVEWEGDEAAYSMLAQALGSWRTPVSGQ